MATYPSPWTAIAATSKGGTPGEWTQFLLLSAAEDDPNGIATVTAEDNTGTSFTINSGAEHDYNTGHPAIFSILLSTLLEAGNTIDNVDSIDIRSTVVADPGANTLPTIMFYLTEDITAAAPILWAGHELRWDAIVGFRVRYNGTNSPSLTGGLNISLVESHLCVSRDSTDTNIEVGATATVGYGQASSRRLRDTSLTKNLAITLTQGWLPSDSFALCVYLGATASTGGDVTGKILFEYRLNQGA